MLEQGGLEQALKSLVHRLTAGTPIKGQRTTEETGYQLRSDVETNLLHIARNRSLMTGSNHSPEARYCQSAVGDTTRLQVIETPL